MKGFHTLLLCLIVINAKVGHPQSTCLYEGGPVTAASIFCAYDYACWNYEGFTNPDPAIYLTTNPCPQPEYTCSTLSTIVEPTVLIAYAVVCSSAVAATSTVAAPPTSPTLAPPTSSTQSLPESTISSTLNKISSTSNQIISISQVLSTISSSGITSSSNPITSSSSAAVTSSLSATSTGSSILAATVSTTYPTLRPYTGGDLLRNYCATAEYTLLPGPASTIVIYAPFIGCVNNKPDCCPFAVLTNSSSTNTATLTSTTTLLTVLSSSSFGARSSISSNLPPTSTALLQPTSSFSTQSSSVSTRELFPAAAVQAQQTLKACPQDYHLVSSSCCPAGYTLYTSMIAGITPCYTPLSSTLNITPPPGLSLQPTVLPANPNSGSSPGVISSPTTLSTTTSTPQTTTQVLNNVILASPFPVQPSSSGSSSISKGQLAAIILSSLGGISVSLSWVFYRKRKGGSAIEKHGYTIAWIAPLEHDALAARNMLDNPHDDVKFPVGKSDDYIYFGGDINGHNVVIATIPSGHSHGVAAMASLARDIKAKFPDVLFGLLVGVASGLPDFSKNPPRDIRLGDVLVAEGANGGACILSYGHGMETVEQAQLNLLAAKTTARLFAAGIGRMKSTSADNWAWFRQYYQALLSKDIKNVTKFRDPGQSTDVSISTSTATVTPTISSRGGTSEARPDEEQIQTIPPAGTDSQAPNNLTSQRQPRPDDERIRVWYGKLGSGDDLKENPQKRQQLKDRYGIIGLETGAASVMDVIERVGVIRGVCDYGTDPSEDWKPFAAATAAAYAKALLYNIDADAELNKTEAQESPSDASGKNPADATTVNLDVLPTPKLSINLSPSKIFSWL